MTAVYTYVAMSNYAQTNRHIILQHVVVGTSALQTVGPAPTANDAVMEPGNCICRLQLLFRG